MAVTTDIPARDFTFELNTGTIGVPVWTPVGGINTWSHTPQSKDADTTVFDDDGNEAHMKIRRGHQFTLAGLFKEDPANGDRDAGQEAVEAWGLLIGSASKKQFRITSPGGSLRTFLATATVTSGGGADADATSWSAAITVSGAITAS